MLLPTSDGSKAKAVFLSNGSDGERAEHCTEAAMNMAIKMTMCIAMDALPPDVQTNIRTKIDAHLAAIVNTSMDAAADAYSSGTTATAAAVGAGVAAAVAATSIGRVRHALYRSGSVLGDVEAVASGNPEKIVRRVGQHVFWRAFGKLGRGIFRGIGGNNR